MGVRSWKRGRELQGTLHQGHDLGQVAHAVHVDALHHGGLGGILGGKNQVADAFGAGANGNRKSAANRAYGAIERKLARQEVLVESLHYSHGAQDAERHRQVEAAALLAHAGRRQIDGEGFIGISEAGVDQRGLDAFAALAHGDIGHPNHARIARRAVGEVDFDIDTVRVDPIDSRTLSFEERHGRKSD